MLIAKDNCIVQIVDKLLHPFIASFIAFFYPRYQQTIITPIFYLNFEKK